MNILICCGRLVFLGVETILRIAKDVVEKCIKWQKDVKEIVYWDCIKNSVLMRRRIKLFKSNIPLMEITLL